MTVHCTPGPAERYSYLAPMATKKRSNSRLIISATLCCAALFVSFLMSQAANEREDFWVITRPVGEGSALTAADVTTSAIALGDSAFRYLSASANPIGSIARRQFRTGEIIENTALEPIGRVAVNQELSLSVRSVDMPAELEAGDLVSLFHLHDSRNQEAPTPPVRILSSVFISSIDRQSSNFGGEVALTVSINRLDVTNLLAATTSGRVVVIRLNG